MSEQRQSEADQTQLARTKLERLVTSLHLPALNRLVIIGRALLDERRMLAPIEQSRLTRAELAWIASALPVDELERLIRSGREFRAECNEKGAGTGGEVAAAPRGWDYVG